MKRSEIEAKARQYVASARLAIERDPLRAVGVALVAGILVAVFARLFITLLFLAAAGVVVLWLLSEKDSEPMPTGFGQNGNRTPGDTDAEILTKPDRDL